MLSESRGIDMFQNLCRTSTFFYAGCLTNVIQQPLNAFRHSVTPIWWCYEYIYCKRWSTVC